MYVIDKCLMPDGSLIRCACITAACGSNVVEETDRVAVLGSMNRSCYEPEGCSSLFSAILYYSLYSVEDRELFSRMALAKSCTE